MMKFIKDLFTEDDAETYCWARVASAVGVFSYTGNAGYMLYHTGTVSLTDYATGFATILAGAGAVIAAKAVTQKPKPSE